MGTIPFRRRMWSLSSFLAAMAALVIAAILANMVLFIGSSVRGYSQHTRARGLVEDYQTILSLPSRLSLENLSAVELLTSEVPPLRQQRLRRELAARRRMTDDVVQTIRTTVCTDETCDADMDHIVEDLGKMRGDIGDILDVDLVLRSGLDIRASLEAGSETIDHVHSLIYALKQELADDGAELVGLAANAHLATELHVLGSNALWHTLAPIFDNRPLSMVEREEIVGMIWQMKGILKFLPRSVDLSAQPLYARSLRAVDLVMIGQSLTLLEKIIAGDYRGVSSETFVQWVETIYLPGLRTLDTLRELSISMMTERARENRVMALHRLRIAAAIGLGSSLVIILLVLQARRSLSVPFKQVRDTAIRLARGERVDVSQFTTKIGEFRNLFDALGILNTRLEERRELMVKLRHEAETDAMTGLMNRMHFEKTVTDVIENAQDSACGIIYVDIDEFKTINDTHGHQVGDELLIEIGDQLGAFASDDVLVGRMGGDEFAMCCVDMAPSERDALAKAVLKRICDISVGADPPVKVSASIGLSSGIGGPGRFNELCREADVALYWSKDAGRNCINWYSDGPRTSGMAGYGPDGPMVVAGGSADIRADGNEAVDWARMDRPAGSSVIVMNDVRSLITPAHSPRALRPPSRS